MSDDGAAGPPSRRGEVLEPLLALTKHLLESQDLPSSLQRIAETLSAMFGFRLVSIVAAEEPGGDLVRHVILGFDDLLPPERLGERVPRSVVEAVMLPENLVFENCYYVPVERDMFAPRTSDDPAIAAPRAAPDAWHPLDSLTVFLRDRRGDMVGYVSVDEPVDGKIPSLETMRQLELFVNMVGLTLANARLLREQEIRIAAQALALDASQLLLRETKNATTDPLTGVANRRAFDETLAVEWKRASRGGSPLSLAMIDIDEFKAYNDLYGHLAGDDCLKAVAATLEATVKRPQDLVVRYGGEEFAIVMPGTDEAGAVAVAEACCAALRAKRIEHARSAAGIVTVSIGVASAATDAQEAAPLIQAADRALYRAKAEGRNRIVASSHR